MSHQNIIKALNGLNDRKGVPIYYGVQVVFTFGLESPTGRRTVSWPLFIKHPFPNASGILSKVFRTSSLISGCAASPSSRHKRITNVQYKSISIPLKDLLGYWVASVCIMDSVRSLREAASVSGRCSRIHASRSAWVLRCALIYRSRGPCDCRQLWAHGSYRPNEHRCFRLHTLRTSHSGEVEIEILLSKCCENCRDQNKSLRSP